MDIDGSMHPLPCKHFGCIGVQTGALMATATPTLAVPYEKSQAAGQDLKHKGQNTSKNKEASL